MKVRTLVLGIVPAACLAPLVFASTNSGNANAVGAAQTLTRVGEGGSDAVGRASSSNALAREADASARSVDSDFNPEAWKARLEHRDLAERERAFDELARIVARDGVARSTVEEWSRDTSALELAWTSRLLLREAGRAVDAPRAGARWNDLRSQMDDLERHFGGLGSMLEDMQRDMDRAFGSFGAPGGSGPGPGAQGFGAQGFGAPGLGGANRSSQSYSMQMGPDGVKVHVDEEVDGKKETKTYTAKTLDELYEAHPELKDKIGLRMGTPNGLGRAWRVDPPSTGGGGLRWFGGDDRDAAPFGGSLFGPRGFGGDGSALEPAVPTDRLGVYVDESNTIDRAALKIDDGVGIAVRGVQAGTMASRMGVEAGDVIVDVNGRTVRGVEDVRGALESRKIDQDVVVTVVDAKGQRRALTWRASAGSARTF